MNELIRKYIIKKEWKDFIERDFSLLVGTYFFFGLFLVFLFSFLSIKL